MDVRQTTAGDLPELHAIFLEAIASVFEPRGFEPPRPAVDVFVKQQRHVLDQPPSLCRVAEDDDGIVGFGSAWVRGDDWFLASMFIRPRGHGAGVGTALLEGVWGEGYARRRTITDAIQPISNALYGRRGLLPATPVLTLAGVPAVGAAAGPALEPAAGGSNADLAAFDQAGYGFDRAVDHAYWSTYGERTTWLREGLPVAYSYVFPSGHIGPIAGLDPAAAAGALAGELARAAGWVRVRLPGSSRGLVSVALAAGLHLSSVPGLLLVSDGVEAPASLGIGGYTLY